MLTRLLFIFGLLAFLAPRADAQSDGTTSSSAAVHLVEIAGPRTVDVGAVAHFRARRAVPSTRPVDYLWDFGDGTLSVGPLVSYIYSTPGNYTIQVVGRNTAGADTLTARLQVRLAENRSTTESMSQEAPAPSPVSSPSSPPNLVPAKKATVSRSTLFGPGGVSPSDGGYTWVVGSELWAARAKDQMLVYRLRGLRADIYVDREGPGSPAYRIIIGQFPTEEEARVGQAWIASDLKTRWLLSLARH